MKRTWISGACLTVLMILLIANGAIAGRNAGGALILHTNDAYTYSSGTKCTTPLARAATCEDAITRSDKAVRPAVWALMAFDSLASPAVTAIYFGLEMDEVCIDPSEISWTWCSPTGVVPSQDLSAEWPGDGESATVSWPQAITQNLFPFLCMRIDEELCGEPSAYISTSVNHVGGYAAFIDDGNPPVTDLIEKFGTVRWYAEGENECPTSGGGDSAGGGAREDVDNGGGDTPLGGEDSLEEELFLAYVQMNTASDSACFALGRQMELEFGLQSASFAGPDAIICRATTAQIQALAADSRVIVASKDSVAIDPWSNRPDTRRAWNAMLGSPPDTTTASPPDTLLEFCRFSEPRDPRRQFFSEPFPPLS